MPTNVEASLAKLKAKIFARFTAEDYGIVLESERILPPALDRLPKGTPDIIGGFEYRVTGSEICRVTITHAGRDEFCLATFHMVKAGMTDSLMEHTKNTRTVSFKDLDSVLMHFLKPRWKDGKAWYR